MSFKEMEAYIYHKSSILTQLKLKLLYLAIQLQICEIKGQKINK